MKTITAKIILTSAILGLLIACGNNKKQPELRSVSHEKTATTTDGDLNAVAQKTTTSFKQNELGTIYNNYLDVKAALVNTDATTAQAKATVMVTTLKETKADQKTLVAALAIASNNDINKQRESFEALTEATELLLKNAISSGEVYKQYCPMAFDGRGASWLSDSKEIRNPYFGNKMLKCGLVKETLK